MQANRHRSRWSTAVAGAAAFVVTLSSAGPAAAEADPADWPEYHRTSNGWRYSPLEQIDTGNVGQLKVAWIHQVGDIQNGLQATPIIQDGVVYYVGPNNNVYAVNGESGETIWHYKPELDDVVEEVLYASQNRGVTVGHGMVYLGTLDGRFIALDEKTGKEKWTAQITNPRECFGCLFSSSPQLAGNILYGGTTGGDQPISGKIYAVNALNGKPAWTFETIKNDEQSWPGKTGEIGGGGAWLPGQYDAETDTIFIGTSNAAPDFYGEHREGDNKYTATYLALDAKSGSIKWYHQEVPHDTYDYDSSYEGIFFKQDGRELIAHLNKGGHVFVYDKKSGAIVNVWEFAKHINWVDRIDPKNGELVNPIKLKAGEEGVVCPYLLGARSWNHGAYSPKTGLWYSNAMEACNKVVVADDAEPPPKEAIAALYLGVSELVAVPPPGDKASARLDARDPLTGKTAWSIDYPLPGLGSVLATAGNLVFNGDPFGVVHAYDAANGKELWNFRTGSGIRAGIVSYAVNGKQYILVPSGWGSLAPGFMASAFPEVSGLPGGSTLIAFTLE